MLRGIFLFAMLAAVSRAAAPPRIMLWSWFTDDDFRFLKTPNVGVAYLALSIQITGREAPVPSPRSTYVRIGPGTFSMAVVRIDFNPDEPWKPSFSDGQRKLTVRMIGEIMDFTKAQALQIDFDAPVSAYPFYRHLLADVRSRVGPRVFLSITALASWCESNPPWLAGLPVDEIVPMAFYMGQASPSITTLLVRGQFSYQRCRNAIGLDLQDQGAIRVHKSQRAYFFNNSSRWSPETLRSAESRVD